METKPRSCDFYKDRTFCSNVEADLLYHEEDDVRQVVASVLVGCHARHTCRALDLGANNGWFTVRMLALGANVTAVEPQPDFARALVDSAQLNCWADRLRVINAFAEANPSVRGTKPAIGFRAGGRPLDWQSAPVPVVSLDTVLGVAPIAGSLGALAADAEDGTEHELSGRAGTETEAPIEYELIKLDADGPEGAWLHRIEALLSARQLRVRTLVVECNNCEPRVLHSLQYKHGYDTYLLDADIYQHFLTSKGIDVYSHFSGAGEPDYLESYYSVRFMRHIYAVHPMTLRQWKYAKLRLGKAVNFLFTLDSLLEPKRPPGRSNMLEPKGRQSGYKPSLDGYA